MSCFHEFVGKRDGEERPMRRTTCWAAGLWYLLLGAPMAVYAYESLAQVARTAMQDGRPEVRQQAIALLGQVEPPMQPAVTPTLLYAAFRDPVPSNRFTALTVLDGWAQLDRATLASLQTLARSDHDSAVRRQASLMLTHRRGTMPSRNTEMVPVHYQAVSRPMPQAANLDALPETEFFPTQRPAAPVMATTAANNAMVPVPSSPKSDRLSRLPSDAPTIGMNVLAMHLAGESLVAANTAEPPPTAGKALFAPSENPPPLPPPSAPPRDFASIADVASDSPETREPMENATLRARMPAPGTSLIPLEEVPADPAARRTMAKKMLSDARAALSSGDLELADGLLYQLRELAVDFGRLGDNLTSLERDIDVARRKRLGQLLPAAFQENDRPVLCPPRVAALSAE